MDYIKLCLFMSFVTFARYFIVATGFWVALWGWKNPFAIRNQIQKIPFKKEDMVRDFKYSVSTCFVFGIILAFAYGKYFEPGSFLPIPSPFNFMTLIWTLFLIVVHDTYFYWMHRTLHHPKLFRRIHRVHHLSKNPSPWAALAFHPSEAVIEAMWLIPLALYLPIPMLSWQIYALVMIVINVIGHTNVEVWPQWLNHPVFKYLNSSTNHNDHHKYTNYNYGIYFSIWDRIMKTNGKPEGIKAFTVEKEIA